jgi:O-antigen/teichoic acid export membrane protein
MRTSQQINNVRLGDKNPSLRKNIAYTWIGNVIYLGTQWLFIVILAKLSTPTDVGNYSLGLALCSPIILFSQMQLRQVYVTDTKDEHTINDYISTRFVTTVIALLLIVVVSVFYCDSLITLVITVLIAINKSIESIADILYSLLQKSDLMVNIAFSMILKGVISLLFFSITLYTSHSLVFSLITVNISWLLILLLYDFNVCKTTNHLLNYQFCTTGLYSIIRKASPLAFSAGIGSFSSNIPRYFLDYYYGKESVALFSIASMPLTFLALFQAAISQSAISRASRYFQSGDLSNFNKLAFKVTGLIVAISLSFTILIIFFGGTFIRVVFSEKYINALPILIILSSGFTIGCLSSYGSFLLTAGRSFKLQLLNILICAGFQVIIAWYLISTMGTEGAGITEFIRYFFSMLLLNFFGILLFKRSKYKFHNTPKGHTINYAKKS